MQQNKVSLKTLVGGIELDNCIYNAAGAWCTTEDELNDLLKSSAGAMVSKSSSLKMREGNSKPRFHSDKYGTINSMGCPNLGYKFYLDYGKKHHSSKPFFHSIIPFSKEEMTTILKDIDKKVNYKYPVELNLSCPNIIGKPIVARDFETFDKYLDTIKQLKLQNIVLGLKLPPYDENYQFDKASSIIKKYDNIKFITCINSIINGLIVNSETEMTAIYPKKGLGGVGGLYCKPIALSNVYRFYNALGDKISIIGSGGVTNGLDAFEHILCGASAVQVGSQLMKEHDTSNNYKDHCFTRITKELKEVMNKKGYSKLSDFKGKLKVLDKIDIS